MKYQTFFILLLCAIFDQALSEYPLHPLSRISYNVSTTTPQNLQDAIHQAFEVPQALRRSFKDRYYTKIIYDNVLVTYDIANRIVESVQDPCLLTNGLYNWAITSDLQITFGRLIDDFEWNIKHYSLVAGRFAYSAGEMRINGSKIEWNLNSGSYSQTMEKDTWNETLEYEIMKNQTQYVWDHSSCPSNFQSKKKSFFPDPQVTNLANLLSIYCPNLNGNTILINNTWGCPLNISIPQNQTDTNTTSAEQNCKSSGNSNAPVLLSLSITLAAIPLVVTLGVLIWKKREDIADKIAGLKRPNNTKFELFPETEADDNL